MYMKTKLKKKKKSPFPSNPQALNLGTAHTPYETNSELKVTLENRCHSGVTVLYTNTMLPPKPPPPKKGGK